MNILLTSTSFQDTPGLHHNKLSETGFAIHSLRGPVNEKILIPIMADYDGIICGDDEISYNVIKNGARGRLKVISKYGVGLDKIDLLAAKEFGIIVKNCHGVNHVAVAEHVIALILTYAKNIHLEYIITKKGGWKRLIGNELYGKKIGIIGIGMIGKEVIKRIQPFGVKLFAYDPHVDKLFCSKYSVKIVNNLLDLASEVDFLSLNLPLNDSTRGIINNEMFAKFKENLIIVNTSRALLIDQKELLKALEENTIGAYITDVMDIEPMPVSHKLLSFKNVLITPHIGSRTYESVQRQGLMAIENLLLGLKS